MDPLTTLVEMVIESAKAFMRRIATSNVSSDMLAKHTLNQPGSQQWQEEPGDMFKPTLQRIFIQSSFSASKVVAEPNKCLMSTQQNNPALLFTRMSEFGT